MIETIFKFDYFQLDQFLSPWAYLLMILMFYSCLVNFVTMKRFVQLSMTQLEAVQRTHLREVSHTLERIFIKK